MTMDPNPGYFYFSLFCEVCVGEGCRQGRARGGVGRGMEEIIFIRDALYRTDTHCFKCFHSATYCWLA